MLPLDLRKLCLDYVPKDKGSQFKLACRSANVANARWLFRHGVALDDARVGFQWVCHNDRLNLAQWLNGMGLTISPSLNIKLFVDACSRDHFELAQWLFSLGLSVEDIRNRPDSENPFLQACRRGNEKMAKWLYSLGLNLQDARQGFSRACYEGQESTARWLFSLGLKIDEVREGYADARNNGHMGIVAWLDGIRP